MAQQAQDSQGGGQKDGQVGWPLIFKPLEQYPLIGRFEEKISLEGCKKPVRMWQQEEEILEEAEDPTLPIDYTKRKKIRRFRPKRQLRIEDSAHRKPNGPPTGLQYEGRLTNLNFEDVEESHHTKSKSLLKANDTPSNPENPFKYVLLEFAKGDSGSTEVNLIPVGGTVRIVSGAFANTL
jgi:hypothetical protein